MESRRGKRQHMPTAHNCSGKCNLRTLVARPYFPRRTAQHHGSPPQSYTYLFIGFTNLSPYASIIWVAARRALAPPCATMEVDAQVKKKTASRLPDPPDWVRFFRLSVIAEIVHKSAQGCTSRKRVQRPPVASQEGAHWRRRARAWKWRRRSKNPRPVGLIRWKLCINLHKDAQAEKGSDDHSLLLGSVETFSDEVSEAETAL